MKKYSFTFADLRKLRRIYKAKTNLSVSEQIIMSAKYQFQIIL
jgi:hypothetical protein